MNVGDLSSVSVAQTLVAAIEGAGAPRSRLAGGSVAALIVSSSREPPDDLAVLPSPASDVDPREALRSLAEPLLAGGLMELVTQTMGRAMRSQMREAETAQRAQASHAERAVEARHEALEQAREASESSGFWGAIGDVCSVIGAALIAVGSVAAAGVTGGASLALGALALGAMLGARYSGEIAKGMADVGIISQSAVDEVAITLGLTCTAISIGASAGAGAGGAVVSAARGATAAAGGAARVAQSVTGFEAASARIAAERAGHQAEVAQEQREDAIDAMHAGAQMWCRVLRRIGSMLRDSAVSMDQVTSTMQSARA